MICNRCGSKLEEGTTICSNCGATIEKEKREEKNISGIIGFIFSVISLFMCISFMLKDISKVGMYTNIMDRLYFAINLVLAPLFLSFISLIICYGGKNNDSAINKAGLFFSIISLFFVITEIVIVIIY